LARAFSQGGRIFFKHPFCSPPPNRNAVSGGAWVTRPRRVGHTEAVRMRAVSARKAHAKRVDALLPLPSSSSCSHPPSSPALLLRETGNVDKHTSRGKARRKPFSPENRNGRIMASYGMHFRSPCTYGPCRYCGTACPLLLNAIATNTIATNTIAAVSAFPCICSIAETHTHTRPLNALRHNAHRAHAKEQKPI
jgi:hypothetical protein